METLRFPYRPRLWTTFFSGLFFAGCGVLLWKEATTNDRGLVINGVIHLGPSTATGVYWAMTAACVGFVLIALLGLVRAFGPAQEVTIGPTTIEAPRTGWSRELVAVPYGSITDLRMQQVRRVRYLVVRHTNGKLTIVNTMLPDKDDIDTIAAAIDQRRRSSPRSR